MRRRIVLAALCLGLPAWAAEPLPTACDLLRSIDLATPLGGAPALQEVMAREDGAMRMSLCRATTADGPVTLSLMLRETPGAATGDPVGMRDAHVAGLRAELGADLVAENVAIGEAGLWTPGVGQLTVWLDGGQAMLILSVLPFSARDAAETVARGIAAATP